MRIEKVLIVDTRKDCGNFELGPINGVKSAILIGDTSKSAWLKAINFVLGYSNEVRSFPREFRNFNGSVELTLNIGQNDNTKQFFKNLNIQTGNKISLRRSIQSQKIDYFINNIHVERVDIKNFLQLFGIAQSYPFQYSVNSDDVALVELTDDKDRLLFLKNCCGVDEFCMKRDKSTRILKETEEQIRKIDISLTKIDVQLEIFASDEKQKIYEDWFKREKELGHFKRLYRIKQIHVEIKKQKADIDRQENAIEENKKAIIQNVENSKKVRQQTKLIANQLNVLKMDEQQLVVEIERCERVKVSLEGSIVELQGVVEQGSLAEDLSFQEKQMYRGQIDQTSSKIEKIGAEIEGVDERKHIIDQQVSELETQVATIVMNCKQNKRLGTQFQSIEKRNEHLSTLIKRAKNAIVRESRNANKLKGEAQLEIDELKRLNTIRSDYNEQLDEMNAKDETQSFHQQQDMFNDLESHRCELIQQNESLMEKSLELKLNLEDVYDKLRSQIGDSIFDGFKSMETLMQSASNELKRGYYGCVIDKMSCDDPIVHKSLPSLMGEHLFYQIVDSPKTATQIMSAFNAADLPGEIYFFVLSIIDSCEFDKSDTVSRLSFDTKFLKVFEKIFSELSLNSTDSSNVSSDTSNLSNSDPGFIEKNGALVGVDLSIDIDPIELYQQQRDLSDMEEATRCELSENSYRMDSTIEQINETSGILGYQHQTMSKIQQVESALAKITQAINMCGVRVQSKQTELQKYVAKVKALIKSKNRYETEMKLQLLTEQEMKSIEVIQAAIITKKIKLQQVIVEIKELQKKHDTIMDYHENSLMSRYSALEEQSKAHSNNLTELNNQTEMLRQTEESKQQATEELVEVQRQLTEMKNEYDAQRLALRNLEQQKIGLEQMQTFLFAAFNEMKRELKNLNNELHRLREVKPYDATQIHNPDIVGMSEGDIDHQLSIAQHQLKTYENTDSFDMNMLHTFTKERETLSRRRLELTKIDYKISQAMQKVEASIQTSIRSTFDELAKHFSSNFKKFVAGGAGRLQLIEPECGQNAANRSQEAIGLNIFAQFDHSEESFERLFGEKRRVVALIFIISMQQLCPAPFYLIDCIDELVFDRYLESLVIYLNDLSNESQIIATSSSHRMLNGRNFIDNTFRSTVQNGLPNVERIPCEEEAI